jgi:hypothetical protein
MQVRDKEISSSFALQIPGKRGILNLRKKENDSLYPFENQVGVP